MVDKMYCPNCNAWVEEPNVNTPGREWVLFHTGRCPKCETNLQSTSPDPKSKGLFQKLFRSGNTTLTEKQQKDTHQFKKNRDLPIIEPRDNEFVMAGPSSDKFTNAAGNPFTTRAVSKAGKLLFKCPTCPNTISVTMQQIDPIVGVNIVCSSCKKVCHVPGGYKSGPNPQGLRITGSVRVPIIKFYDWYFEHPFIISLIKSGQSELLNDYGLWASCGVCYHPFLPTVINAFAMTRRSYSLFFNARTSDSARDMEALRNGHCSQCPNNNLNVIVAEIPDYVRNTIIKLRN